MSKDALELLKADHRKVKDLLAKLTKTTTRAEKTRKDLLAKIDKELSMHNTIEEEIFYPAFVAAGGAKHKEMNFEALEEHRAVADLVLPDLKKTDPTTEKFSGRANVLKELVEHHVEEEEKEMFKEAKKSMSTDELKKLGAQMSKRKAELKKSN